jgi:DNA-binding transcriptional LysR family regulator
MDRLAAMTSFVKVVENGGFSAAARRLDISTSIVTTHIQSLEGLLGVRLLNRSTRKVGLTEVGQAYYERCVQILSDIDEANQIAEATQIKPRGVLRLNVAYAVPPVIAPSIAEFVALYPEASVRVTMTSRMPDLIEEGFDLSIRVVAASDSNLIVRHLGTYRWVVCGSPSYFASHGQPQHPAELVHHNCLMFYDSPLGRSWRFEGPEGEQVLSLSGNVEANDGESLLQTAILGQGLVCFPSFMVASELKSGQLLPVLSKFLRAESHIDAFYPHRRHLSAKVRSFIDLVAKNFREANWTDADEFSETARR